MACYRDTDYEEVMGNAFQTPLLDIWRGQSGKELFRKLHREGQWNEIPICSRCDTWMCKTRMTLVEEGRLIVPAPLPPALLSPPCGHGHCPQPHADRQGHLLAFRLLGAVSDSGRALAGGLINLTVRSKT